MIEAVIVDFDDTLSLTEKGCFDLENEVLSRMGRTSMSREIHRQTWGQPLSEAIKIRSPGIDLDEFWHHMPAVHERFITTGQVDVVTDENIEALNRLIALDKKVMVLTSRTEVEVRHILDAKHRLAEMLTDFYHKDNMEFHKPDPRAFDVIERDHNLKPEQCVYVGDSPGDAAASSGAGLRFIACLESGLRDTSEFAPYKVDCFIDRFPEVVEAVQGLELER